ncbi:MAG: O-antigen ligase family protein [Candidatus Hydrogenedentes bacterium]|nr:O-antigen ligase family protein [Candidatus Hydrogenedentota bacterium]
MDKDAQKNNTSSPATVSVGAIVTTLADEYLFIIIVLLLMVRPWICGRTFPASNTWFQFGWISCMAIWFTRSAQARALPVRNVMPLVMLLGFTCVCALTMLTGIEPATSYRGLCETMSYLLAFYLVLHVTPGDRAVRGFVIALVSVSVLIALYGYIQRVYILEFARRVYLQNKEVFDETVVGGAGGAFWERMQANRIFSTFLHAGSLAGYLAVCMPLTCGLMMGYRRRWHLAALAAGLTIQGTALLLTATRGAWLAFAISSCVGGVIVIRNLEQIKDRIKPLLVAFFVSAVLAVVFTLTAGRVARMLSPVPEQAQKTEKAAETQPLAKPDIEGVSPTLNSLTSGGTFIARQTYWRGAINMIMARPIIGMGWQTFGRAYPKYMELGGYPSQFTHNDWLEVLAETGVIGFIFYAGFWIIVMKIGSRLVMDKSASAEIRWLRVGIFCGLLGFMLHGLVDFDLYNPGIALLVFVLAALLLVTEQRPLRHIPINMVGAGAGAMALAFAAAFCYCPYKATQLLGNKVELDNRIQVADSLLSGTPVQAKNAAMLLTPQELKRFGTERVSPAERNAVVLARLDVLRHRLERARMWCRFDPTIIGYLGVIDHISSHSGIDTVRYLDSAIRYYKRACELSPLDFNFNLNLARAYIERGNYPANSDNDRKRYYSLALQQFQAAASSYPTKPAIWREWGRILKGMGQEKKGEEYQQKADYLQAHYIT